MTATKPQTDEEILVKVRPIFKKLLPHYYVGLSLAVAKAIHLARQSERQKFLGKLYEMQQDNDCDGYKEHKVGTVNTVYEFDLENNIRLKNFAESCFRNGWLHATEVLNWFLGVK